MLSRLNHLAARPIIWIITIYQWTFSPDKSPLFAPWLRGRICAHEPHCSAYSIQVLKKYGLFPWIIYMVDRISSCTPSHHIKHDPSTLRVVFASSAPIGVPFLEKIASDSRYDLVWVVTNPDQPVWRGMKVRPNIIKETAQNLWSFDTGKDQKENRSWKKSNIILLHGKKRPTNNHLDKRIIRTQKKLQQQWYKITIPFIDKTREIWWKERKDIIDQHSIDENTILIGHSAGATALLRRLHENDQKIEKLILIAPWYIPADNTKQWMKDLYNFELKKDITKKIKDGIILFTSNDKERPKKSAEIIKDFYNPKNIHIEWRIHFSESDGPQNDTFSELLDEIAPFLNLPEPSWTFISTPQSLRLDSKKYANKAAQFQSWLQEKKPDLLVVIAYGKIIPQHILDIPTIAPINVHGSLLPTYRGASPIQSVLLNDEKETGITIMKMDTGLDTGPMLSRKSFPLTIHTTAGDIIKKFQDFGPKQLVDTMRDYAKWHIAEKMQDHTQATHTTKLEKSDGLIDPWSQSLHEINNIYRGCFLRPKAHFVLPEWRGEHTGKTITIDQMTLDNTLREAHKKKPLFLETNNQQPKLNPAATSLTLKPANSKAISREDFLNGYYH